MTEYTNTTTDGQTVCEIQVGREFLDDGELPDIVELIPDEQDHTARYERTADE